MHTVMVITGGFVLLGLGLLIGRMTGSTMATAALYFLPLWLIAAGINMWVGVTRAGYSVAEEFPIFLFVFAVPAAIAVLIYWKSARA